MKKILTFFLSTICFLMSVVVVACSEDGNIIIPTGDYHTEYEGVYITLQSVDVSEDSSKLNVTWHNETDYKVVYTLPYQIEYKNGDEWINIQTADVNYDYTENEIGAKTHKKQEYSTAGFDVSKTGVYRLRTSCVILTEENLTCNLWVEFTVKNLSQVKSRKLTAELDDWLCAGLKKDYKAGEKVVVKIALAHDINVTLYINGKLLHKGPWESGQNYWQYTFTMPNEDVVLTYKTSGGMQRLLFPTEFSFSLTWGTFGISSYDSETGNLVKTKNAPNPAEYITTYHLTTEEKMQIREILIDLDILSYPDVYNPTEGNGSSPSQMLILNVRSETVNHTITAVDVAYSEGTSPRGQKFMDACKRIGDILMATDEWKALPDYPYLYD